MPALPGIELRLVIAIACEHFAEFAQIATLLLVAFADAVLARAIIAFHLGGDPGQFFEFLRVVRRRHRGR
jgi:hypothetical protein